MSKILTISPSPHLYGKDSVNKIMYGVIIAMVPAMLVSFYFYGIGAVITTLTAVVAAVAFEYLIQKFMLKQPSTIMDGSAVITGFLLAFNLPSNIPIYLILIGVFVAIAIGKMSFGGLGANPFNPALVGRVFLLISFPVQMTTWPKPAILNMSYIDAETGATPLAMVKEALNNGEPFSEIISGLPSYMDMFWGNVGGSLGEISVVALLIGFAYMLIKKIITWHIPVTMLGTIFIFSGIMHLIDPEAYTDPVFQLLTGGAMLGAIFMATDMVTSPMSVKGQIVFAVGIGVLTVVIRTFGAYPEGVSFAILIMNAFVPLINTYMKPKRFGEAF